MNPATYDDLLQRYGPGVADKALREGSDHDKGTARRAPMTPLNVRVFPGRDSLWSERIRAARSALVLALHRRAQARAQMVAGDLETLAALSADNALEAAAKVADHHGSITVAAEIRSLKVLGP